MLLLLSRATMYGVIYNFVTGYFSHFQPSLQHFILSSESFRMQHNFFFVRSFLFCLTFSILVVLRQCICRSSPYGSFSFSFSLQFRFATGVSSMVSFCVHSLCLISPFIFPFLGPFISLAVALFSHKLNALM